ncbi:hypothetical protein RRG08_067329 [Elysia crispata]|uniref:Uncharacterized protein n=1 Tax=Elysia crispata TaxID=231223 RepID=A0AAE1B4K5_9GAST|nr:hypothetical protein RRG08_067329 [Elysia crispata]
MIRGFNSFSSYQHLSSGGLFGEYNLWLARCQNRMERPWTESSRSEWLDFRRDRSPPRLWPNQNGLYDYCVGCLGLWERYVEKDGRVLYG